MRIPLETALLWSATAQRLLQGTAQGTLQEVSRGAWDRPSQRLTSSGALADTTRDGSAGETHAGPVDAPEGNEPIRSIAAGRNEIAALCAAVGGVVAQPNHAPVFSLVARTTDFQPSLLFSGPEGSDSTVARMTGMAIGPLLAPRSLLPVLNTVARQTGEKRAAELVAPLSPGEVRRAMSFLKRQLSEGGKTLPELRSGAPKELLRPIERGGDRARYQEQALLGVLNALEQRGDVATTLIGGVNTSEGPYRFHLRSRIAPGKLPPIEEAYAELASWYIHAFAPAGARDMAAWSGLTEVQCRRALGRVKTRLRVVEVPELGEELLAPESYLDQPVSSEPFCLSLPWQDAWFHAYRNQARFLTGDLGEPITPRDVALVTIGPGAPPGGALAARIALLGSAREPHTRPQPWRPLAEFEVQAMQSAVAAVERLFHEAHS